MSAPANSKIGFSFIGFVSQEVTVDNQSVINITLVDDSRQSQEVVVSGLATSVKRSNAANAVASIGGNRISGVTKLQTVDGALNGKIAGVQITANSGAPGAVFQ